MPVAAKTAWQFWWYLFYKSNILNIFEGELFIKILSLTLLQTVYKLMLHFKVIVKSMTGADDTCQEDLQAWMG